MVVGRVTKVHGLRGEIAIRVFSDNPNRFAPGSRVFLEDGRALTVAVAREHGGRLLVTFEGVEDRTAAEALRGLTLVVPESMLPSLPPGEYWPHQLVGCEVLTESGRRLGTLTEVVPNAANDLWVAVDDEGTETLVPALTDVIVSVDLATNAILVRDVPGLTIPDEA